MAYNKLQKLSDNIEAIRIAFDAANGHVLTDSDKAQLSKYSGFGGLKFVLYLDGHKDNWRKSDQPYYEKTQELWQLLRDKAKDDAEYRRYVNSVRSSVLTSFYTPEPVVEAIASSLNNAGINITTFLEPSSGAGIFIDKFQERNKDMKVTCFEKDLVTGKVLAARHPESAVHVDGYETIDSRLAGTFDVAASNIPFGNIKIFDPFFAGSPHEAHKIARNSIHNYFFMKTMSMVRDGGVIAFITSRGVFDSDSNRPVRESLMQQSNLVSVVRLPDGMFRDEAGTDVGSDLIILQRNDNKVRNTLLEEDFIRTVPTALHPDVKENAIFANGSRSIFTQRLIDTDPYGKPSVVYKYDGRTEDIAKVLERLLAGDIKNNLDKELYGNVLKEEQRPVLAPKTKTNVKSRSKADSSPYIQLSLFDMWDNESHQEEEKDNLHPRPFVGALLSHYRDGMIITDNGQLGVLSDIRTSGPTFTPEVFNDDAAKRLRQYLLVRDAYQKLYEYESTKQEESPALRRDLNEEYDTFVRMFGYLNSRANSKVLIMDAQGRDILTLENPGEDGKTFVKADIFSRPVSIKSDAAINAETPEEALSASLNKTGGVDLDYMSEITGMEADVLRGKLGDKIYINSQGRYEVADKFLSGNIYEKISSFPTMLSEEDSNNAEEIRRSLRALESVKPAPIPFEDIDFNFGERWMPKRYFSDFASKFFDTEIDITYASRMDEFVVSIHGYSAKISHEYVVNGELSSVDGSDLLRHALYNTVPTINKVVGYKPNGDTIKAPDTEKMQLAASKIDEIREGFTEWINQHDDQWKQSLADIYNRKFNCYVRAKYDGSHQTLPDIDLKALKATRGVSNIYQSQKDCVWMILQNGGGICDHEVGTGKTLIMCIAAHEMKRLGLAKKPVIIGMKANVAEIAATYQTAYPDDRILYASPKDFKDRASFFNRMKNNDYDCIIMSHDQFTAIPQSSRIQADVLYEEILALDEALEIYAQQGNSVSGRMLSGLEKRKQNLEAQLRDLNHKLQQRSEDVVDFETMGIDHIFVDESQVFKNLSFTTRDNRVAGLGDPSGSQRARNLQYAIRTIQKRTGKDLGATFLSGTTISNSLTELYLLFKYLRPQALQSQDINSFDAWAAVFARKSRDYEINVAGSIVMKERFRHFIKVPELAAFYNEITDYRTANDVGLDRPDKTVKLVNIEPTESHKDFSQRLIEFAKNPRAELIFRTELSDNEQKAKMLLVTGLGKKASLSPRLVNPDYEEGDNTKLGVAAKNISEYYTKYKEHKGTQFVFCDLSTPKKGEWNAYHELKDRLVHQYGIPEYEIAFIQEATTENKRKDMISKMNRGDIRILFGSTTMLGTGVNAQEKAVAVHHLDLPWRPSDMEQRNGRAQRKGNEIAKLYANNNVDILVYAVERSLDSYNFYLLQAKSDFIRQLKNGSLGKRTFDEGTEDETNGMPFAEFVAITSGNTDLLERAKMEKKIIALESEYKAFRTEKFTATAKLETSRAQLASDNRVVVKIQQDKERLDGIADKVESGRYIDAFIPVSKVPLLSAKEVGAFLIDSSRRLITSEVQVGTIYGMPVIMVPNKDKEAKSNTFYVKGQYRYSVGTGRVSQSKETAALYPSDCINRIPEILKNHENRISELERLIPELERISSKEWPKQEELRTLKKELEQLDRKIMKDMEITSQDESVKAEELPYTIENTGRGREPFLLTYEKKDYPFVRRSELGNIADNLHGKVRYDISETVKLDFRHQFGAEEAIKKIGLLNKEHKDDVNWLVDTIANLDKMASIPAKNRLAEMGLDRYGRSLVSNGRQKTLEVVALGDYYNDADGSVRELAHGVNECSMRHLSIAEKALAETIKKLPQAGNAVLVSVPSHRGYLPLEQSRFIEHISKLTGIPYDVYYLSSVPYESLYEWKKNYPGEPLPELFYVQNRQSAQEYAGRTPILIDNVIDSGTSAWAAVDALEETPVMVVIGATGNHDVNKINVRIDPQGLSNIHSAIPEGVGMTGVDQHTFEKYYRMSIEYGISGNNATTFFKDNRLDVNTGLPNFIVSDIVNKWKLRSTYDMRDRIKDIVERYKNDPQNFITADMKGNIPAYMLTSYEALVKSLSDDSVYDKYYNMYNIYRRIVIIDEYIKREMQKLQERNKNVQQAEAMSIPDTVIDTTKDKSFAEAFDYLAAHGNEEVKRIIEEARRSNTLPKNLEDTSLTPTQWVYVRTQEFKTFFGDNLSRPSQSSQAMNFAAKEPLNLYHGAVRHSFDSFRNDGNGIYFTPSLEAAQTYGGNDVNPYKVFVNMRNPLIVDFNGDTDTEENEEHKSLEAEYHFAVDEGYDGVIALNTFDGENVMDQYVVHNQEDIMFADDQHLLERMGISSKQAKVVPGLSQEDDENNNVIPQMNNLDTNNADVRFQKKLGYPASNIDFVVSQTLFKGVGQYDIEFGNKIDLLRYATMDELMGVAKDHDVIFSVSPDENNRIRVTGARSADAAQDLGNELRSFLAHRINQNDYEIIDTRGTKEDENFVVDFGFRRNLLENITIAELESIGSKYDALIARYPFQNNRVEAYDFQSEAEARQFGDYITVLYDERQKQKEYQAKPAESPLRDVLVERMRNAGIKVSTDRTEALAVLQSTNVGSHNNADVRYFRTSDGSQAYGFVHNGTIYLDPMVATAETAIHEYTHLWSEVLRQKNPEEWSNIVSLMKQETELWHEVKVNYPELTNDDAIADEVLAHFSGRRGSVLETMKGVERYGILDSISEAVNRFWKFVGDFFNIHYTSKEEVADKVFADLVKGVNPLDYAETNDKDIRLMKEKTKINPIYTGLFVQDKPSLVDKYNPSLPVAYATHITQAYRPGEIDSSSLGLTRNVLITGRLITDKVDALLVDISDTNNKHPHITLATADGVAPKESNSEIARYLELLAKSGRLNYELRNASPSNVNLSDELTKRYDELSEEFYNDVEQRQENQGDIRFHKVSIPYDDILNKVLSDSSYNGLGGVIGKALMEKYGESSSLKSFAKIDEHSNLRSLSSLNYYMASNDEEGVESSPVIIHVDDDNISDSIKRKLEVAAAVKDMSRIEEDSEYVKALILKDLSENMKRSSDDLDYVRDYDIYEDMPLFLSLDAANTNSIVERYEDYKVEYHKMDRLVDDYYSSRDHNGISVDEVNDAIKRNADALQSFENELFGYLGVSSRDEIHDEIVNRFSYIEDFNESYEESLNDVRSTLDGLKKEHYESVSDALLRSNLIKGRNEETVRDVVIDKLRSIGIEVVDSVETASLQLGTSPTGKSLTTKGGERVFGFAKDGKIYVDTSIATVETPIHEYTHLWAEAMRQNNPQEWSRIKYIMTEEGNIDLIDVLNDYPELTHRGNLSDDVIEEALARYSGRYGHAKLLEDADKAPEPKTFIQTMSDVLNRFWSEVMEMLGIKERAQDMNTASDVADRILSDLMRGVNPNEHISETRSEARFQKVGATTVNKVTWQGTMDVYSSGNYLSTRPLSLGVKRNDPESINEASKVLTELVRRIPNHENAVLVPIPNRDGNAGYTLDLANKIKENTGLEVADILTGKPHKPLYDRKESRGNEELRLMRYDTKEAVPEGKKFILVDNVLDTGTTAMSAMRTLGDSASLVVIGSTTNSKKYNYPINISVAPVITDNLTASRAENADKALYDYYTAKYSERGAGTDIAGVIHDVDLRDWSSVRKAAEQLEIILYSNSDIEESEKNKLIQQGSSEALSTVLKKDSFNRLSKDIRTVQELSTAFSGADDWRMTLLSTDNKEAVVQIPKSNELPIFVVLDGRTTPLTSLNEADYNIIVSQMITEANQSLLTANVSQLLENNIDLRLSEPITVTLTTGEQRTMYAYNVSSAQSAGGAGVVLGEHIADVVGNKGISIYDISVSDRHKAIDAVLRSTGLYQKKTLYLNNYAVDSAAISSIKDVSIEKEKSPILTEKEVSMLSQVVTDFETGNHLLGRPRPEGYREFMAEVVKAGSKVRGNHPLAEREVNILKMQSSMYHDGLSELAFRLETKEVELYKALDMEQKHETIENLQEALQLKALSMGVALVNNETGASYRIFADDYSRSPLESLREKTDAYLLVSREDSSLSGWSEGIHGNGWTAAGVSAQLDGIINRWQQAGQTFRWEQVVPLKEEYKAASIIPVALTKEEQDEMDALMWEPSERNEQRFEILKARRDNYIEYLADLKTEKEATAQQEGRTRYYVADVDGYGQRNGDFRELWLKPEDVQMKEVGSNKLPSFNGHLLHKETFGDDDIPFGGISHIYYYPETELAPQQQVNEPYNQNNSVMSENSKTEEQGQQLPSLINDENKITKRNFFENLQEMSNYLVDVTNNNQERLPLTQELLDKALGIRADVIMNDEGGRFREATEVKANKITFSDGSSFAADEKGNYNYYGFDDKIMVSEHIHEGNDGETLYSYLVYAIASKRELEIPKDIKDLLDAVENDKATVNKSTDSDGITVTVDDPEGRNGRYERGFKTYDVRPAEILQQPDWKNYWVSMPMEQSDIDKVRKYAEAKLSAKESEQVAVAHQSGQQSVETPKQEQPAPRKENPWENYDYTQNSFPEGVDVKDCDVTKIREGENKGKYRVTATINGEQREAVMYKSDVNNFFKKDASNRFLWNVTRQQMAAKYFAKDYVQQAEKTQQLPQVEESQALVSQGTFKIPTYAVSYFANGSDGLDGLNMEDVEDIQKFEATLKTPVVFKWPEDIDKSKQRGKADFGGDDVDYVEVEVFHVVEKQQQEVKEEAAKENVIPEKYSYVQMLKDDAGNYVLYAVPEGGKAFTAYPSKEDRNAIYESFSQKNKDIRSQIAAKYYAEILADPSKETNIFKPEATPEDMQKIESSNIFKSKDEDGKIVLTATINGERQEPIQLTEEQYKLYWLAPDKKEYKTMLAAKLHQAVLHPELSQQQDAPEKSEDKNEIMEKEPEQEVKEIGKHKPSPQSELLLSCLQKAKDNDGVWLNDGLKKAPEYTQKGNIVSPFTSLMMAADSDKNGYKTNVYTSYSSAKEEGFSILRGQQGLPVNWYKWDSYANRYDPKSVISKDVYEQLPDEEKELYRPVLNKKTNYVWNIEQTTMAQEKADVYKGHIADVEKNVKSTILTEDEKSKDCVRERYAELKAKHPDAVLLFRCGDFYEVYDRDAETSAKILGVTLTVRPSDNVKMAGFPYHALDTYLPKLIRAGERVAVCDSIEPVSHVHSIAVDNANKRLEQLKVALKQLDDKVRITNTEETGYKDGVLTVNDARWTENGKEFAQAAQRLNDAYRAVAAYATAEGRLSLASRDGMLPEDGRKYENLVQELSSAVLMTRMGMPSRLTKDNLDLLLYWERELKEDPKIIDNLERDVNNTVKVVMEISRGKSQNIDYGKMRGERAEVVDKKSHTIASDIATYPSIENKTIVVIKDAANKSVDVVLPNGASLEMGEDISGMKKDRIIVALRKEGFDPEKIQWYNAGGAFALKQPNEYFKGKEVEISQLKQYTLIPKTRLNLNEEISRTSQVQLEKVQLIRDDYRQFALYVKPSKEYGEAFTVYPEPKDIKKMFEALTTHDSEKVLNTSQEIGKKYYKLVQGREELKANIDFTPKYDTSISLDRVESVNITRDKKDPKRFVMYATIDGSTKKGKEVSSTDVERYFLVGDRELFKKQLAAKLFIAELKPELVTSVKQDASEDVSSGAEISSQNHEAKPEPSADEKVEQQNDENTQSSGRVRR